MPLKEKIMEVSAGLPTAAVATLDGTHGGPVYGAFRLFRYDSRRGNDEIFKQG